MAELVLITGGTGLIGYTTVVEALKQGYRVRAAVRSEEKAEAIKKAESTEPYISQLEFVIVKDITVDGAFDEAVQGVDAIIHLASPLPAPHIIDFEEELIKPAVHGTTGILYSALKEKKVRRVVVTSSVGAVFPWNENVFTVDDNVPMPEPPFANVMFGYRASKIAAHKAVEKFITERKPQFNIHSIMPTYVVGRNVLAKTTKELDTGSNALFLGAILGRKNDAGSMPFIVHVEDVAYVHVAALDKKIGGNRNFGADYDYKNGFRWVDTLKYTKELFPEAVKGGLLPADGHTTDTLIPKFDISETEKVFDFKFKGAKEMTESVVGQYLELKAS